MSRTKHVGARMSQRGITLELLELARSYGTPVGDKSILGTRECDALLNELDALRIRIIRARDKGGVVVVEDGEIITTYNYEGFGARRARRRPRGY